MLNAFIAFALVLAAAFGLYSLFGIKSQFTPLVALALLIDVSVAFSLVDMLKPGVIISYLLAILIFAAGIYKNRNSLKDKISEFLTPGVILFIIACTAMLVFLAIRQPFMSEWDEFSFWGISQKLLKIHDQIYTYYKSSMIGNSTPPTLAVLSYFFGRFNREFCEWISFFAYDVMFFSCYRAFTASFDKKQGHTAFFVYLFGFLVPYVFEVYTRIIFLEPVYITTYADIPLGVVFAGGLALYLFSDRQGTKDILPLLPLAVFLTLIKDMGFALSCIIVFIIFFDMLIRKDEFSYLGLKGLFGKISAVFTVFASAVAAFMAWAIHMSLVMSVNRFELGGETNMGMVQMLITGAKELLIGPRSEKFTTIFRLMIQALYKYKISMIGSGVVICALVLAMFVAAIITADKKDRPGIGVMYLTSLIGFIGYYVFHIFLYVYIFKDNAYELVSYNRYIYPYYIGWLCLGVFAVVIATRNGEKLLPKMGLIAFTAALFLLFNHYTSYDCLFIECNDRSFVTRKDIKAKVAYIQDAVGPDDVLYVYSGGDNGERWFIYTYEFAGNYVMEDFGTNVEGLSPEEAKLKYQQTLRERFINAGVTNILLDSSSEFFRETFGELFDEDIGYVGRDSIAYYKVNYTDDSFYFTLVKGGTIK